MGSKLNARTVLFRLAAVALSGAALYLSEGLNPRWWAMWIAALPVLAIAPGLSWPAAATGALAAGVAGGMSMWSYHDRLQLPLWLKLASLAVPAIAFCAAVLAFRILLRRGRPWLAAAAFPAVMAAYEYLISLAFGTFGTTAYTQLNNWPVMQLGALSGLWGISFAVLLFSPMVAVILLKRDMRARFAVAVLAVYGFLFAYGGLRLRNTPPAPHSVAVGLVASDLPNNFLPNKDEDAMRLLREYGAQVKPLSARGAKIVVMPEMIAVVRDSISGEVDRLFGEAARNANAQVLVGVLHVTSNAAFNEARLYSESGALRAAYRKHHLVPVLEGSTTPANEISVVPDSVGTLGLEICRDMDYPDPAQRYGKAEAGLVLVPAWDFDVDRSWHGHMAIMRGIENGFSMVRAAKQGLLTVSDDRGRILAETRTSPEKPFTTMVATVPVRHDWTLYQSWGDWFAWLDLAAVAGILAVMVRKSASRPQEAANSARDSESNPARNVSV